MTKEQLLNALRLSEEKELPLIDFWDEFVTIFAIIDNATEEQINQAWSEVNDY
jgi:hypothetical protein